MSLDIIILRSKELTGDALINKISSDFASILSKHGIRITSDEIKVNLQPIFTKEMEDCFKEYKISMQIRGAVAKSGAVDESNEILFDFFTDLISYLQRRDTREERYDQITLSFGLHYSYIKGNSRENHITDLLDNFQINKKLFKVHYKKDVIRRVGIDKNPLNKKKIYFYLNNRDHEKLLSFFQKFILAIHKSLDKTDTNLERTINNFLLVNRPPVDIRTNGLMLENIIIIDPILFSQSIPKSIIKEREAIFIIDRLEDDTNLRRFIMDYARSIGLGGHVAEAGAGAGGPAVMVSRPSVSEEVSTPEGLLALSQTKKNELTLEKVNKILSSTYSLIDNTKVLELGDQEIIMFSDNPDIKNIQKIKASSILVRMRIEDPKKNPYVHFFKIKEGGFYQKYLKYKTKYLKLKNHL